MRALLLIPVLFLVGCGSVYKSSLRNYPVTVYVFDITQMTQAEYESVLKKFNSCWSVDPDDQYMECGNF